MTSYPGNVVWPDLAEAARSNATGLLDDARLLLEHGRFARAYAMAVLGLEEIGKYYLCLKAAAGLDNAETVWRQLGHHRAKLETAAVTAALFASASPVSGVMARLERFVSQESATKFRGLYVDWEVDRVADPTEVSSEAASEVVALLGELVAFIDTHDVSLLAPNLANLEVGAALAENAAALTAFVEHLKTLEPAEAKALANKTTDELVAGLRELLGTASSLESDGNRS